MRENPCNQCGAFDFYTKGKFSYCRPCHAEAQKRYASKISEKELLKPPSHSLEKLLTMRQSSGRLKTHCVNGHPLSGDNVRISSQRDGKWMRRCCKTCERNAKRVKYGLAPEPKPTTLGSLLDQG
jgi:hypothetical protein